MLHKDIQHFWHPPSCASGWMRKHVFMGIFVVGHQIIILTGVLSIDELVSIGQTRHGPCKTCRINVENSGPVHYLWLSTFSVIKRNITHVASSLICWRFDSTIDWKGPLRKLWFKQNQNLASVNKVSPQTVWNSDKSIRLSGNIVAGCGRPRAEPRHDTAHGLTSDSRETSA